MESKALLVIIGSNNKAPRGLSVYSSEGSIVSSLHRGQAELLLQRRREVLEFVLSGTVRRGGVLLRDLPYNLSLVKGPDLGGMQTGGRYLPAAERFCGRFYSQLGQDAIWILTHRVSHHVLIVTPLYGLVTASELIQSFSCDIDDAAQFRAFWSRDQLLTKMLSAYIAQNGITCVLDLTAEQRYRTLVDWQQIATVSAKVLHCFGLQTTGDALLVALGDLADLLLTEFTADEIERLDVGQKLEVRTDTVVFQDSTIPPRSAPLEQRRLILTRADQVGRMHGAINHLLRMLLRRDLRRDENIPSVLESLLAQTQLPPDIATNIRTITACRSRVVHHDHQPDDKEWESVKSAYAQIKAWAEHTNIKFRSDWIEFL